MRRFRAATVTLFCTAFASWGCGGSSKGASGGGQGLAQTGVPTVDPSLCSTDGKRVETYDLNKDKKPDVWKLYQEVDEGGTAVEVLTCKQVDYDHDGSKDYVATYAQTGELIAEAIDLTFDGKFDAREHYDKKTGKLVMIERDSDHDKKTDVWEEYDENGSLKAVRVDRNADGRPDLWEQYTRGELMAILYDDDYDNRVDRRESRRQPAPANTSNPATQPEPPPEK